MNDLLWIVILLALLLIGFAFYLLHKHRQLRREVRRLEEMLDCAQKGSTLQEQFDESLLSSLETKLFHVLRNSSISAQYLSREKERIQELLADLSHQSKTPLANILLYVELLLEGQDDPLPLIRALKNQSEKLRSFIQSLIQLSRLETGVLKLHPQDHSLVPFLQDVILDYHLALQEKQITLQLQESEAICHFDPKWTHEVFSNLLDNAIKYSPLGSSIEIAVTPSEMFTRVDIQDQGIGIAEDEQAQIFSRFYRGRDVEQHEGVGIGLYLSRKILEEQAGYISVQSQRAQGSCFSVFLPTKGSNEA